MPMTTDKSSSPTGLESESTSSLEQQVLQGLKTGPDYRYAFVEEKIRTGLATQIHAIREQRRMDPKEFAAKLGRKLSWTYRLEDPNDSPPTIPSLLDVARALGVDLDVRFRPFSDLLGDLTLESPFPLNVPSFEEELPELERLSDIHNSAIRLRQRMADLHRSANAFLDYPNDVHKKVSELRGLRVKFLKATDSFVQPDSETKATPVPLEKESLYVVDQNDFKKVA